MYVITHLGTGLTNLVGVKMSLRSLYRLGLDRYDLITAVLSIGFMELVYGIEKQNNMRQMLSEKPIWIRWPLYSILVLFLILFGEFNDHPFIYFQF
jgi:hypothetical protein